MNMATFQCQDAGRFPYSHSSTNATPMPPVTVAQSEFAAMMRRGGATAEIFCRENVSTTIVNKSVVSGIERHEAVGSLRIAFAGISR